MKKTLTILIAFLIALVLAPIGSSAHAADLIVGQNTEVIGNVSLWCDGAYLYVKYEITNSNWCMTKTHLHLAMSPEQIPQTKGGNPILGLFDYRGLFGSNSDGNLCGGEYVYKIQLGVYTGTLYIAAHADVVNRAEHKNKDAWADGVEFLGDKQAKYFTYAFEVPR